VLLSGEAGIGKSRLTAALLERLTEPHTRLRDFCSPQHTDSAFYPSLARWTPGLRPPRFSLCSSNTFSKLICIFQVARRPQAPLRRIAHSA
jgi:predicted ATPase